MYTKWIGTIFAGHTSCLTYYSNDFMRLKSTVK